jgi:ABC-2 type transport system permease protein
MEIIRNIIKKEFLQFKRDPKMFAIILLAPVVQLIFLGYAATLDVNVVKTAVWDLDKSKTSREFIQKFEAGGYFRIAGYYNDYADIEFNIDKGNIILGLVIPNNFEEKIIKGEPVKVQAIFDGSDGNTASIAAGYVQNITGRFSNKLIIERLSNSGKSFPVSEIESKPRVWFNPELKTRMFMVPAIVGLLLMLVTIILTSLAIVKEKEIGTLEQLIVTPIKPYQLIIGKLVPFALLGFVSIIIVLTAMRVIFNISVQGSTILLFVSSFVYILSTLGLGMLVSTISKTQQQAMMLSVFGAMLPMVYLSGFAFPIENMPEIIQYITYVIPLRYFLTIIRGIILKGIGFAELWFEFSMLLIMGIVILLLSSFRFQKRLE